MRLKDGEEVRIRKIKIGGRDWMGIEIAARKLGMSPHRFASFVLAENFEKTSKALLEAVREKLEERQNED